MIHWAGGYMTGSGVALVGFTECRRHRRTFIAPCRNRAVATNIRLPTFLINGAVWEEIINCGGFDIRVGDN